MRRFLRHLSEDAALADDLAQETFLRAYRGLSQYRGDASFLTWILGIAHNQHRNARRRRKEVDWEEADAPEPSEPSAARGSTPSDLSAAMKRLDPNERTALHLFYHQGLTHPEISKVSGWPLGTVKTHLLRGKDKLRTLLAPWNPQA